jgi:hypothetical protein
MYVIKVHFNTPLPKEENSIEEGRKPPLDSYLCNTDQAAEI